MSNKVHKGLMHLALHNSAERNKQHNETQPNKEQHKPTVAAQSNDPHTTPQHDPPQELGCTIAQRKQSASVGQSGRPRCMRACSVSPQQARPSVSAMSPGRSESQRNRAQTTFGTERHADNNTISKMHPPARSNEHKAQGQPTASPSRAKLTKMTTTSRACMHDMRSMTWCAWHVLEHAKHDMRSMTCHVHHVFSCSFWPHAQPRIADVRFSPRDVYRRSLM